MQKYEHHLKMVLFISIAKDNLPRVGNVFNSILKLFFVNSIKILTKPSTKANRCIAGFQTRTRASTTFQDKCRCTTLTSSDGLHQFVPSIYIINCFQIITKLFYINFNILNYSYTLNYNFNKKKKK